MKKILLIFITGLSIQSFADAFNDMFTKGSKMKVCMKEQGYEYKN